MPDREQQSAINDILCFLGDTKMYVNEKKLYINAIDKLYHLGYYKKEDKQGEKVSLYRRFV